MSQSVLSCPKCNGEMVLGHVLDIAPNGACVGQWTKGEPKKVWRFLCWYYPIRIPESTPIGTFRCGSCGFLESYARSEFAPK